MGNRFTEEYGDVTKIRLDDDSEPIVQRPVEVDAVDALVNPDAPAKMDDDEFEALMLSRGFVRCRGRCMAFKPVDSFAEDDRNPGRLFCRSYCKECEAVMKRRKRQASHETQAAVRYEYRQRKPKKLKRRRK